METRPPEFDHDYDLEVDEAGQIQMDVDPLLGPYGPIPESDMVGPSGTVGMRSRIPCVPRCTRTTTTSVVSEPTITNVLPQMMMSLRSSLSSSHRQMMMSRARMLMPFLLLAVVIIDR